MKKLQSIIASAIITGLVITGMLSIGIDAVRTANRTVASGSGTTLVVNATGAGTASAQLVQ